MITDVELSERLGFARQLITGSRLSVESVAGLAGFESARSFGKAFEETFGSKPSALRSSNKRNPEQSVELKLAYQPPMHWDALLGFFRGHLIVGVEQFSEDSYGRVFRLPQGQGNFRVSNDESNNELRLNIVADNPAAYWPVMQRVQQMFDLAFDPVAVGKGFAKCKLLKSLWKKTQGLRVASGWDPFEVAICTILGQLVSTKQATALARQLVAEHGEVFDNASESRLFPTADVLADAALETVRTSPNRKKAIRAMAAAVVDGKLDFYRCDDITAFKDQLLAMPGIGPWTAEYIGLRGMRDKDSFPRTDLFLKRAIADNPDLDLNVVRPWRSYAAIYLWRFHQQISPPVAKPATKN